MLPIRLSELPEAPLDVSQSGIFPVSDVPNDITYKLSLQQIPSLSENQNIKVKTASYTITKNDYNTIIYFNNAISTTANLTIPNNSSKKIQPGYSIKIIRYNSGHVRIVPENGVTIYSDNGTYLKSQYSVVTLTKIDTNNWIVTGHLYPIPIHVTTGLKYPLIPINHPNNVVLIGNNQNYTDTGYTRNLGFNFPLFRKVYNIGSVDTYGSIQFRSVNQNQYGFYDFGHISPLNSQFYTDDGQILENTSYVGIYAVTWNNVALDWDTGIRINMQVLLFGPNNTMNITPGSVVFSYGNMDSGVSGWSAVGDPWSWSEGSINSVNLSSLLGTNIEGYINDSAILANKSFMFQYNDGTYRVSEY